MRTLVVMLLLTVVAGASTPGTITYQGRLTDAGGQPMDTTVDLTFRIYSVPSGGGHLWVETHSDVVITDGLFDLTLGSIQPFGSVFNGETRYMSVQVGAGMESDDRTQIVSVPYAMKTSRADTAYVAFYSLIGGGWVDDGSVVRLLEQDDSVAIGTSDPDYPLHVESDMVAIYGKSYGGPGTAGVYGRAEYDAYGVQGTSSHGRGVYGASTTGYGGYFLGPKSYVSGNLGIGTEDPSHKLTVKGALGFQVAEDTKYHIGYYNGGLNFTETAIGDYRLFIENGGQVGIGTSSPQRKLHVAGDTKVDGNLTAGTFYSSNITDAVGIASAASGTYIPLFTATSSCISREITVPTSGYIIAFGCADVSLTHTSDGPTYANVGASADPMALPTAYAHGPFITGDAETGVYGASVAFNRLFYCPSAGTYTYYIVGNKGNYGDVDIGAMELDLIFCRTVYSSKASELHTDEEDGESIRDIMAARDAAAKMTVADAPSDAETDRLITRIDMLTSEIEALKERLQALEGQ